MNSISFPTDKTSEDYKYRNNKSDQYDDKNLDFDNSSTIQI